jgi:hypothetical protein
MSDAIKTASLFLLPPTVLDETSPPAPDQRSRLMRDKPTGNVG